MFEIIKKEKVISFEDEILPPCWINKDLKQAYRENNYFEDTQISKNIWVSGNDEKLLNELKASIDNAKEMICITSYIFSEPEIKAGLLNASKRGVRVYMLTASNKHLKKQPDEDDDFNIRMYIEMDILFKELQGKIKIRTSENFHTKFLLIDPLNSEHRQGYLLTSNFDTKGIKGRKINDVFRVNPEICINLSNDEIIGFFNQFCYGFWIESTEESKIDGFLPIRTRLNKDYELKNIIFNSKEHHSLEKALIDLIAKNSGKMIICTYGITKNNEVYKKILSELKKGRDVVVLTRPRNKNMPALIDLIKEGAVVYGHDDIHAKVILIEENGDVKGIMMTANIEDISFDTSFESGKILKDEEAKSFLKILNNWIKNFPLMLKNSQKLKNAVEEIRVWNSLSEKIDIKRIVEEGIIPIDINHKSKSIENYEDFEIPKEELKKPNEKQKLYKKIIYQYEIKPPILPRNAKPYQKSNKNQKEEKKKKNQINLPIYKLKNKLYVVIKEKSQIRDAKILAEQNDNAEIVTLEKFLRETVIV